MDETCQARRHGAPSKAQARAARRGAPATAREGRTSLLRAFDHFAAAVTRWCGSPTAFCAALALIGVWGLLGPLYGYSEDWQLVVNTGTTIVTFLMVFLIQQSQNKDSVALHLKLDELLAAHRGASNRMIGIEMLDEQDLREVAAFYARLAERAKAVGSATAVHSIDEEGMPASRGSQGRAATEAGQDLC